MSADFPWASPPSNRAVNFPSNLKRAWVSKHVLDPAGTVDAVNLVALHDRCIRPDFFHDEIEFVEEIAGGEKKFACGVIRPPPPLSGWAR
jgi:hypothetical protein